MLKNGSSALPNWAFLRLCCDTSCSSLISQLNRAVGWTTYDGKTLVVMVVDGFLRPMEGRGHFPAPFNFFRHKKEKSSNHFL